MSYTRPDHGSEHREPLCRGPQQRPDRWDRCDHPQPASSCTSQPCHCNSQCGQLKCCHQQVCADSAQTLAAELSKSQTKLGDAENELRNAKSELEDIHNKLKESQKESEGYKEKWEKSQRKFEEGERNLQRIQKGLKYNDKSLQRVQQTLRASEEQLEDSKKRVEEGLDKLQQLEGYKTEVGHLKILLFEAYGQPEQYDEAEKTYYDILNNHKETIRIETILKMKYSYAEQLHKHGGPEKAATAKEIAEDVWKRRIERDSVTENTKAISEETKQSHRQICSIYTSLQDFDAAEYVQRLAYQGVPQGVPRDDWMLENGDALVITLKKRKKYEEAARLRLDIWKERWQPAKQGLWDSRTVRSALMCISFLKKIVEDLSKTLSEYGSSEEEQDDVRHRMRCHEREILKMLQEVWRNTIPESRPEILEVGHELGSRLVAAENYSDAEGILTDVWEARTALSPEANQLSMSTGRILVDVIRLQESPQRYERAASLYRRILDKAKLMFGEDNDWVISVGITLAETLFVAGKFAGPDGAEGICQWVLEQKEKKLDPADPQVDDARYNLGKAVHAQESYARLPEILEDVYDRWNNSLPKSSATIECGRMLLKAYERYEGRAALDPIQALFDGRGRVSEKDMLYLESGHSLGKRYLNLPNSRLLNLKKARDVLSLMWNYQANLLEEKRIRLRSGQLYGQSLFELHQYSLAKKILEDVEHDQRAQPDVFGEGSTESDQVAGLLGQVKRAIKPQKQSKCMLRRT